MKLKIKVKPASKIDEIVREADGNIKVKIKGQPIEGKANKYLIEYISEVLNLPKSKIVLLKGETNAFKTLEIDAEESYVNSKLPT